MSHVQEFGLGMETAHASESLLRLKFNSVSQILVISFLASLQTSHHSYLWQLPEETKKYIHSTTLSHNYYLFNKTHIIN